MKPDTPCMIWIPLEPHRARRDFLWHSFKSDQTRRLSFSMDDKHRTLGFGNNPVGYGTEEESLNS